jgi:hypothetical protein
LWTHVLGVELTKTKTYKNSNLFIILTIAMVHFNVLVEVH